MVTKNDSLRSFKIWFEFKSADAIPFESDGPIQKSAVSAHGLP